MKNTHEGVLLLVKLPASLLKLTLLYGCFSRFLNFKLQTVPNRAKHHYIKLSEKKSILDQGEKDWYDKSSWINIKIDLCLD